MREAIRVTCMLVIAATLFTAAFAWGNDRPTVSTWVWRITSLVIGAGALVLFLIAHFQQDEIPDYLFEKFGTFLECNGFCFVGRTIEYNGICHLEIYFQSQQDNPCTASISLKPALSLFLSRASISAIKLEIPCETAAFGVARLPISVLPEFQGTQQTFEVSGFVDYPEGKGKTFRFRDGIVVRDSKLMHAVTTALSVGGAMTGQLIIYKPPSMTLDLPKNVAVDVPWDAKPKVITLWKLFDPPLEAKF